MKLFNNGNAKTKKGEKLGYITYGIHLAPASLSGFNVCQFASKGCTKACLNTAGRGNMSNVQKARINKTLLFFKDRAAFLAMMRKEVKAAINSAKRKNMIPCFRPNLTSDLPWEKFGIIQEFPEVQWYDYTKSYRRALDWVNGSMPSNYHLTFSRSEEEENQRQALEFLSMGGNVAVVFRNSLPDTWEGYKVIDGDETDLRFLDGGAKVIGLVEKGKAKKDETGFVVTSHLGI